MNREIEKRLECHQKDPQREAGQFHDTVKNVHCSGFWLLEQLEVIYPFDFYFLGILRRILLAPSLLSLSALLRTHVRHLLFCYATLCMMLHTFLVLLGVLLCFLAFLSTFLDCLRLLLIFLFLFRRFVFLRLRLLHASLGNLQIVCVLLRVARRLRNFF